MKKYRRGSKIVELVKRTLKNAAEKNIEQIPVTSTEAAYQLLEKVIDDTIPTAQPSTSTQKQEDVNDQDETYETSQKDITYNIFIFQTPASTPTTFSNQITSSNNDVQNNTYRNDLQLASSMDLLNDDLYLTDSSDEYIPSTEVPTTSSDIFANSLKPSPRGSVRVLIPNQINKNQNSSQSILISNNREHYEENMKTDAIYISGETTAISGQHIQKRKRNQAVPCEWKKNVRKNKRLRGEPYLSAKGVLVPGKTLKESKCMGQCIYKCASKFTEEERLKIFSFFWNISTVEQKRLYIVNLIRRENTKAFKKKQCRKKLTNKYFLRKIGGTEKIRVCQKFFVATLNVSETFVRFCFKKVIDSNVVVADKRGKHAPHNKKSMEIREHVRNHIKSFPRLPAPRVRKDTKREYLSRNLNLTKMYNLYKIKCDSEQRESVELAYYRSVFKKDFNIGFHRPGRDICDICFSFERMNEEQKRKEKVKLNEHLNRICNARQHRNEAKSLAQFGEIHYVEYDLKAICDCSSASKLNRRLPVYNFTALDFNRENRNVLCFCWHEGIARKGAAEIGSCLYKYLQSNADGKPIIFMSDTCASQCRNMYISSLLLYCIEIFNIPEINQKYFEQGHSQMETDNIHSDIEKVKKNMTLLDTSDYYDLIRKSLQKYPHNVYEMKPDDFIDLKYLKSKLVKNAKVDHHGEPVNWLNIRWLQYRKENPNNIYFKYDLDDREFNKIEVIRRGKRIQNCDEIILLTKPYLDPLPFK